MIKRCILPLKKNDASLLLSEKKKKKKRLQKPEPYISNKLKGRALISFLRALVKKLKLKISDKSKAKQFKF